MSVVCSTRVTSDYSMNFHGGSFDYSMSVVCSTRVVIIPWRKP